MRGRVKKVLGAAVVATSLGLAVPALASGTTLFNPHANTITNAPPRQNYPENICGGWRVLNNTWNYGSSDLDVFNFDGCTVTIGEGTP